jgi:hypothetical protein
MDPIEIIATTPAPGSAGIVGQLTAEAIVARLNAAGFAVLNTQNMPFVPPQQLEQTTKADLTTVEPDPQPETQANGS